MLNSRHDQFNLDFDGRHGAAKLVIETTNTGTILQTTAIVCWSKGGGLIHSEGIDFRICDSRIRVAGAEGRNRWTQDDLDAAHRKSLAEVAVLSRVAENYYRGDESLWN